MADGVVQVAPDSSGAKIDNTSLTVGANNVMRQRVQLAGQAAAELADIRNVHPTGTDYGLVVRHPGMMTSTVRGRPTQPVESVGKALRFSATPSTGGATSVTIPFSLEDYTDATTSRAEFANYRTAIVRLTCPFNLVANISLVSVTTGDDANVFPADNSLGQTYKISNAVGAGGGLMAGASGSAGTFVFTLPLGPRDRATVTVGFDAVPTNITFKVELTLLPGDPEVVQTPFMPEGQSGNINYALTAVSHFIEVPISGRGRMWFKLGGPGTISVAGQSAGGGDLPTAYLRAVPFGALASSVAAPSGLYEFIAAPEIVSARLTLTATGGGTTTVTLGRTDTPSFDLPLDVPNGVGLDASYRVLATRANAAAPTWTEAKPVPLSVDLAGNLRTIAGGASDVSDRAARLVGIVYGDQGQLLQRAATRDALVQLRSAGAEIDPRDVSDRSGRALGAVSPAAASVWDVSDRLARLLGAIQGDVAKDVANTGNPLQGGGIASLPWVLPTPVAADGRRVGMWLDRRGRVIVGPVKLPTYASAIRAVNATAGKRSLATGALTANTNKQIATIWHANTATKRARLLYVKVVILELATAAGYVEFEIVRITAAPVTGNPAITPLSFDSNDAAAECAVLALPTTQGTVGAADQAFGNTILNLGITATAGPTVVPPAYPIPLVLFDSRSGMDENKDAVLRAGVAEGFAIVVRSTGVGSVLFMAEIQHTEEP